MKKNTKLKSLDKLELDRPTCLDLLKKAKGKVKNSIALRKKAAKEIKEFVDDGCEISSKIFYQISQALGGVYIVKKFDLDTKKAMSASEIDRQSEEDPQPYDIFSYDELVVRFGQNEADEMVAACSDLDFDDQYQISLTELNRRGVGTVSATTKKLLDFEGTKLNEFKRVRV